MKNQELPIIYTLSFNSEEQSSGAGSEVNIPIHYYYEGYIPSYVAVRDKEPLYQGPKNEDWPRELKFMLFHKLFGEDSESYSVRLLTPEQTKLLLKLERRAYARSIRRNFMTELMRVSLENEGLTTDSLSNYVSYMSSTQEGAK